MHNRQFFVLDAEQQFNKLLVWISLFWGRADCVSTYAWKVFRKFCPLCYKQVIALSPRRTKDKFSLVFSKFSQLKIHVMIYPQFCSASCDYIYKQAQNHCLFHLVFCMLIASVLWHILDLVTTHPPNFTTRLLSQPRWRVLTTLLSFAFVLFQVFWVLLDTKSL